VCVCRAGGVLRHDPCKSSMGKHEFHGFKSSQFAIETTINHDHLGELILVAIRRHKSIRLEHAHCCKDSIFVCVCVCVCVVVCKLWKRAYDRVSLPTLRKLTMLWGLLFLFAYLHRILDTFEQFWGIVD